MLGEIEYLRDNLFVMFFILDLFFRFFRQKPFILFTSSRVRCLLRIYFECGLAMQERLLLVLAFWRNEWFGAFTGILWRRFTAHQFLFCCALFAVYPHNPIKGPSNSFEFVFQVIVPDLSEVSLLYCKILQPMDESWIKILSLIECNVLLWNLEIFF